MKWSKKDIEVLGAIETLKIGKCEQTEYFAIIVPESLIPKYCDTCKIRLPLMLGLTQRKNVSEGNGKNSDGENGCDPGMTIV